MADLRALLAEAGAADVETYIQSGNAVFEHAQVKDDTLRDDLEARIEAAFGFHVPVILRRASAWDAVIRGNPFPDDDPTRLHVSFLRDRPRKGATDGIDRERLKPEEFLLKGREVYLYLPSGIGRAKLPAALTRVIGTPDTARNWRTVLQLAALAG
jgi:uncharacterized protein (DUF1697 family)